MDFSEQHVQHFMASRMSRYHADDFYLAPIYFRIQCVNPVFGNSDQLWAEIETCWETFMQNEFHVMSSTVGYLWADLLNIREQYNAL